MVSFQKIGFGLVSSYISFWWLCLLFASSPASSIPVGLSGEDNGSGRLSLPSPQGQNHWSLPFQKENLWLESPPGAGRGFQRNTYYLAAANPAQGEDLGYYYVSPEEDEAGEVETYLSERERRGSSGPSLSIVNPLDVLRQRLLLEIGRRRQISTSQKINANSDFLKSIGRRRRR